MVIEWKGHLCSQLIPHVINRFSHFWNISVTYITLVWRKTRKKLSTLKQFWVLSQGIWERLFKSSIPEKKEVLQSCWYWLFQRKLDYIQFEKNRCTFLWRKLSFEIARHGNFTTLLQIPSWRKVEILNSLSLQGKVILQRSQKTHFHFHRLSFPYTLVSFETVYV